MCTLLSALEAVWWKDSYSAHIYPALWNSLNIKGRPSADVNCRDTNDVSGAVLCQLRISLSVPTFLYSFHQLPLVKQFKGIIKKCEIEYVKDIIHTRITCALQEPDWRIGLEDFSGATHTTASIPVFLKMKSAIRCFSY